MKTRSMLYHIISSSTCSRVKVDSEIHEVSVDQFSHRQVYDIFHSPSHCMYRSPCIQMGELYHNSFTRATMVAPSYISIVPVALLITESTRMIISSLPLSRSWMDPSGIIYLVIMSLFWLAKAKKGQKNKKTMAKNFFIMRKKI